MQAVISKLNFWQKLTLAATGIAVGGGDVGTGGGMEAALAVLGIYQLVTDFTFDLANALSVYNNVYPSG